jgi:integrase
MASVRKRRWRTASGETKTAWIVDYGPPDERRREHFQTKRAADAFRVTVENQIQSGTYRPDASKLTLREACDGFLRNCEGRHERDERMTRKMLTVYRGHISNYIIPVLGSLRLSQVTARAVGEFRDQLRTKRVSVPTTRKILATLHGVLAFAVSQDWIATNAAHGVRVIGPRDEGSKKIVPPSKAALLAIINEADEGLRLMIIFAASTGARAGEQWAARWADVDLDRGELRISRRVDAYGEEGPPKSAAGIRTVPLSAQLVASLREWKLRSEYSRPNDLIFANQRGGYIGHDNLIKRRWLAPFNWHGLRHFAVSAWIEAGLTPKTVQTFAGHASLQVTMDRYGHLFPSDDHKRAMDHIANGLFV